MERRNDLTRGTGGRKERVGDCPNGANRLVERLDGGEFDSVAHKGPSDLDMVAGMGFDLILGIEKVDFIVEVLDEDVFCAFFYTTLGTLFVPGVGAGNAAPGIRNPAFPATVSGWRGKGPGEKEAEGQRENAELHRAISPEKGKCKAAI